VSEEFEEFGYNPARYERPARDWICGHACDGKACKIGPSSKGKCRATFECVPKPFDKEGLAKGGFKCTRPTSMGGACEKGPLPDGTCCKTIPTCQPVRSVRAQRGLVVFWTAVVSLGFLLLMLCSPLRAWFVAPGELAAHHQGAAMRQLNGSVDQSQNCSACHTAALEGGRSWVQSVFTKHDVWADSKRCIDCHDMGPEPFTAHQQSVSTGASMDARMACSNCHKEHRGAQADLKRINDRQCQTCHQQSFNSFAKGHPEFKNYPYNRRTRIQFDHARHIDVLFIQPHVAEFAPKTCADCHKTDAAGQYMEVKHFDQTCAKCHMDEIRSRSVAGIGLPALDLPTLEDANLKLGSWPANADDGYEGPLTDTMKAVLERDPQTKQALEHVASLKLYNLGKATPEQLVAVHQVGWAIKMALNQVSDEGLPAWDGVMLAGLPVDLARAAIKDWLPNLESEIAEHAAGKDAAISAVASKEPAIESLGKKGQANGGWYRDDDEFTLNYHPSGHADPYLQEIINANPDHAIASACTKCHSVDGGQVNWQGYHPEEHVKKFNRFNHGLHFMLMDEKGCLHCHQVNKDANVASGYADRDPQTFVSSFLPMQKAICQQCHNGKSVRDDCLTCHQYHVGHFPPALATPPGLKTVEPPPSVQP
jgi:hypothetical protein